MIPAQSTRQLVKIPSGQTLSSVVLSIKVLDTSKIKVYRDNVLVTAWSASGDTVSFNPPIAGQCTLSIVSDEPIAREYDITKATEWNSSTINTQLDKIQLQIQQVRDSIGLIASPSDDRYTSETLNKIVSDSILARDESARQANNSTTSANEAKGSAISAADSADSARTDAKTAEQSASIATNKAYQAAKSEQVATAQAEISISRAIAADKAANQASDSADSARTDAKTAEQSASIATNKAYQAKQSENAAKNWAEYASEKTIPPGSLIQDPRFTGFVLSNGREVATYKNPSGINWLLKLDKISSSYSIDTNGNGIWMIATPNGTYRSIDDGDTWSMRNNYHCYSVRYGDGIWVLSAYDDTNNGKIFYSDDDGDTWQLSNIQSGKPSKISYYANGIWQIGIYYSEDGRNYEKTDTEDVGSISQGGHSCTYDNGIWIRAYNNVYHSEDGRNWNKRYIVDEGPARSVCGANGIWIINTDKVILWSNNAFLSCKVVLRLSFNINRIYYANNVWLACTNNAIFRSENGEKWTAVSSLESTDISYNGFLWCSVGKTGSAYSLDSINWFKSTQLTPQNRIVSDRTTWVSVGDVCFVSKNSPIDSLILSIKKDMNTNHAFLSILNDASNLTDIALCNRYLIWLEAKELLDSSFKFDAKVFQLRMNELQQQELLEYQQKLLSIIDGNTDYLPMLPNFLHQYS